MAFLKGGQLQAQPAQVVWRGDISKGQPDLALLKVPVPLDQAFDWATECTNGSPVLAVGSIMDGRRRVLQTQCMAGQIIRLGEFEPSVPRCAVVYIITVGMAIAAGTADLHQGHLLGINVAGKVGLSWKHLSIEPRFYYAQRPELDWSKAMLGQYATTSSKVRKISPIIL